MVTTIASTLSTTRTTTQPPVQEVKDPDLDAVQFNVSFSFSLNTPFQEALKNVSSPLYTDLSKAVIKTVENAYVEEPAFDRCVIRGFSNGSIKANYIVVLKPNLVFGRQENITEFMKTKVNDRLMAANITINNETFTVNNSQMLEQLDAESKKLLADYVCMIERATICPPCYRCKPSVDNSTATCQIKCSPKDNKYCIVKDNTNSSEPWQTDCSCNSPYLLFGDDCVHQNVIIGVTVGVGGGILLALIVALIVVSVRKPKTSKSKGYQLSHEPSVIGYDVDYSKEGHYNDGLDTGNIELSPIQDQSQTSDYNVLRYGIATANIDHTNIPSNVQQSSAFVDFVPQLQNVDVENTYVIQRPKVLTSPDYKKQTGYYDEFF